MCMSKREHDQDSIALVSALLRLAPGRYTTEKGRWVWVCGKLASMIIRWSRLDMAVRQEVEAIQRDSRRRGSDD
jgi:hypothetical protein